MYIILFICIHTHMSNTSYAIYTAKEINTVMDLISVFQ